MVPGHKILQNPQRRRRGWWNKRRQFCAPWVHLQTKFWPSFIQVLVTKTSNPQHSHGDFWKAQEFLEKSLQIHSTPSLGWILTLCQFNTAQVNRENSQGIWEKNGLLLFSVLWKESADICSSYPYFCPQNFTFRQTGMFQALLWFYLHFGGFLVVFSCLFKLMHLIFFFKRSPMEGSWSIINLLQRGQC